MWKNTWAIRTKSIRKERSNGDRRSFVNRKLSVPSASTKWSVVRHYEIPVLGTRGTSMGLVHKRPTSTNTFLCAYPRRAYTETCKLAMLIQWHISWLVTKIVIDCCLIIDTLNFGIYFEFFSRRYNFLTIIIGCY